MFLSRQELQSFTAYVRPSAQIKWLIANKIQFIVGADGHPRVSKQRILRLLDEEPDSSSKAKEPNFDALSALIT